MTKWKIIPVMFLLVACVDKITFDIPRDTQQMVIEGSITNEPGPYTIYLSKTYDNAYPQRIRIPVPGAQIDLYENDVKIDTYSETSEGVYQTSPSVRGQIGRTYYVKLKTFDNREYTSEPELLQDPGTFDNITREFSTVPYNKYDIYIDAHPPTPETFLRWTIVGTWRAKSFPELATTPVAPGVDVPTPLPCSGVSYSPFTGFVRFGPCTCCECWITDREVTMRLNDNFFLSDGGYVHTNAGVIKVNRRTFFEKYHAEIIQMAISPSAHEFFRQLKAQGEGVGSLFQPSFGEIVGNVKSTDGKKMLGFFWAAGRTSQKFFIEKDELPIIVEPIDTVTSSCDYFGESTYTKPSFWP